MQTFTPVAINRPHKRFTGWRSLLLTVGYLLAASSSAFSAELFMDYRGAFSIHPDNYFDQPFFHRFDHPAGVNDGGHGEAIAIHLGRVRAPIPANDQVRLVFRGPNAGAYDLDNFFTPVSFQANLLGFDPAAAGFTYPPGGFIDHSGVTFNDLLLASSSIRSFTTPSGLLHLNPAVSLDVTNYVQSRPLQSDASGDYLDVGFAIRDLTALESQGGIFAAGWFLESRDGSAAEPFLPTEVLGDGTNRFIGLPGRRIYDPPVASGFIYRTIDGSLFTEAFSFPAGFTAPFTVTVNGNVVGQFNAGDSVDFTGFVGGGVSQFEVRGIAPLADPEDPLAFPLGLDFNQPTASFDMIAIIPEPNAGSLLVIGGLILATTATLRKRRGESRGDRPRSFGHRLRSNGDSVVH